MRNLIRWKPALWQGFRSFVPCVGASRDFDFVLGNWFS
jgi:hypothetical protein